MDQDGTFEEELQAFQDLQTLLSEGCGKYAAHPACIFYQLEDLEYFRLIAPDGWAPHIDFHGQPFSHLWTAAMRRRSAQRGERLR